MGRKEGPGSNRVKRQGGVLKRVGQRRPTLRERNEGKMYQWSSREREVRSIRNSVCERIEGHKKEVSRIVSNINTHTHIHVCTRMHTYTDSRYFRPLPNEREMRKESRIRGVCTSFLNFYNNLLIY